MAKAIENLSAVERDLYDNALPEQVDALHRDPRAWRDKLVEMYRNICDEFQARKAEALRIRNIVARNEYEAWKVQANKRKEKLTAKIKYVKNLIHEESQNDKLDYKEEQLILLREIRDELRAIRGVPTYQQVK